MQNLEESKGINSSELRSFLTGLILGDGTIDNGITKRSFRIKSIHKDFIEYISDYINCYTNFKHLVKYIPEHFSCGCNHKECWEFVVKAHPYFNKKYHYFYNDKRHRKIYAKTLSWLTPIGLANWYMSDGYVCLVGKTKGFIRDRRVDLCTDRYFKEDVELIKDFMSRKFNIKTSIIKRNNTYRIRVNCESYETFFSLIAPYIVDSMKYKLYLGYTNKPKYFSDAFWNEQLLISATTLTDNAEG